MSLQRQTQKSHVSFLSLSSIPDLSLVKEQCASASKGRASDGVTALREVSFLLHVPSNLPCWILGACRLSAGILLAPLVKAQLSRIAHIAHESQDPGSFLIP